MQPDGVIQKQPEGTITQVNPDGTVVFAYPDGRVETLDADGSVETQQPDGTVETPPPAVTPPSDEGSPALAPTEIVETLGIGEEVDTVAVIVAVIEGPQPAIFINPSLPSPPQGSIALDVANWDGAGPMTIFIDWDGDGVYEQILSVENAPIADLLNQELSTNDIINILGELDAYLDLRLHNHFR